MRTNLYVLLAIVFVCWLQQLSAMASVGQVSEQLLHAGDPEIKAVVREAKKKVAAVRDTMEWRAAAFGDGRHLRIGSGAPENYTGIDVRHNTAKAAFAVARDTYARTERLSRKAVEAIEGIIRQAEKEAFELKAEKRRRIMLAFLSASKNSEKQAWKYGLRDEYLQHLQALEAIVKHGEEADTYQDLVKNFETQRGWFVAALEKIQSPTDKHYFLLFQKAQALRNVLISFDRVANMLDQRVNEAGFTVQDIDKARVLALYDIQALVTDKVQPDGIAEAAFLSTRECGIVVEGLFNKLAARKQIDDLMAQKKGLAQELLARDEQLRLSCESAQQEKQASSTAMQEGQKNGSSESLDRSTIVPLVETLNKENASLQLIVLDQQRTIAQSNASAPLAVTNTLPQPLSVAPVSTLEQKPPSTVQEHEQQARVALENELKQKMMRG